MGNQWKLPSYNSNREIGSGMSMMYIPLDCFPHKDEDFLIIDRTVKVRIISPADIFFVQWC